MRFRFLLLCCALFWVVPAPGAGRIDLNTASEAQLRTLPGVGKARARAIIRSREVDGPFRREVELARVPGFGPALVKSLRGKVSAGDARPSREVPPTVIERLPSR
ncbi:ComEA family DNA-binding protein [Paludibacterium paludis]|uniref:Helix-hairpin-helix DNA-binding motif class 1 domain-containing protein n=1 Tax=Paludibacterium paludis TaxID=1225769 RepID=A0A918U835_9NEIS|nr:helix-hairpin-helix domain-containing protein [Paludibacterium paludis]GGY08231.1 hypothetical protein GCM10011289_08670 [Paludibacterium paludis]